MLSSALAMRETSYVFSPLHLPFLRLWLRAQRITGLNSGDPVTTWPNLGGGGSDAAQAVAANKGLWIANAVNGRAAVRGDGVDDFMTGTVPSFDVNNCSMFMALKTNNLQGLVFNDNNTGVNCQFWEYRDLTPDVLRFYSDGTTPSTRDSTVVPPAAFNIASVVSGANVRVYVNGAVTTLAAMASLAITSYRILDYTGAGFVFDGDLAEFILCGVTLDEVWITRAHRYMSREYGITLS